MLEIKKYGLSTTAINNPHYIIYNIKFNYPKSRHLMWNCIELVTKRKWWVIYDNDNHPLTNLQASHILIFYCSDNWLPYKPETCQKNYLTALMFTYWKTIMLFSCRYRNLIERALRARLVYGSPNMNRSVSFEYMNRQLVWNEFSVTFAPQAFL